MVDYFSSVLRIRFINKHYSNLEVIQSDQHRLVLDQELHQCFPPCILCKMTRLVLLDIPSLWKALKNYHLENFIDLFAFVRKYQLTDPKSTVLIWMKSPFLFPLESLWPEVSKTRVQICSPFWDFWVPLDCGTVFIPKPNSHFKDSKAFFRWQELIFPVLGGIFLSRLALRSPCLRQPSSGHFQPQPFWWIFSS